MITGAAIVHGENRVRLPIIVAIAFLTIASTEASGQQRAKALAAQFQSYCLSSEPNFERLGKRAEQQKLQIQTDRKMPIGTSDYILQRNWIVEDFTGQFLLLATTGHGETLKPTENCGIAAADIGGDAFEKTLIELPVLGSPTLRVPVPSGGFKVQWNKTLDWGNAEIMLASGVPGMQGSIVTLIYHPIRH